MLSEATTQNGGSRLGAQVRALRRERGLTLKALGQRAGLSHPFLSQVERGLARPSLDSVQAIAGALEVPVGQLWAPPRPEEAQVIRRDEGAASEAHGATLAYPPSPQGQRGTFAIVIQGGVEHGLWQR